MTPPICFLVIDILDQNSLISTPYPRPNCLKAIPSQRHILTMYTGHVWEYPPPRVKERLASALMFGREVIYFIFNLIVLIVKRFTNWKSAAF